MKLFQNKILPLIILLSGIWACFFISKYTNQVSETSLLKHVPNTAKNIVRVNNKALIKSVSYNLLYKSNFSREDLKSLEGIQTKSNTNFYGIDLSSELIYFSEEWHNQNIFVLLFDLIDESKFKDFELLQHKVFAKKNNKGVVIAVNGTINEREQLQTYAADLLIENKDKSLGKLELMKSSPSNMSCNFYLQGNENSKLNETYGTINLKNDKIEINATANLNPVLVGKSCNYSIKNDSLNHFSFNGGTLLDTINSVLNTILDSTKIKAKTICAQNIHFYGSELSFGKNIKINPVLDAVIRVNEDLTPFLLQDLPMVKLNNDLTYTVKVIDANHIFIGVNQNVELKKIDQSVDVFNISGAITNAIEIKGTSTAAIFARNFKQYKSSYETLQKFESLNVSGKLNEEGKVNIVGLLTTKDHSNIDLDLIELILDLSIH